MELGDGTAHRVADDDGPVDAEDLEEGVCVVGAVGQPDDPVGGADARGRARGGRGEMHAVALGEGR